MTRTNFGALFSLFFCLNLYNYIPFFAVIASATTTASVISAHQPSKESLFLAASNTCPAHIFSFEDYHQSEEGQEECMSYPVCLAAARLHPLLRSSSSSAVVRVPTAFPLKYQQPQKHTMSSESSCASTSQSSAEQPKQQQPHPSTLGLPAPSDDDSIKLDVSGEGSTIKLDHLGPLVVNQDGTMSRISNWDKMTDIEKRNTLRVLGKRNKQRLEALKAAGAQPGEKPEDTSA
jgi:hypothetical protein